MPFLTSKLDYKISVGLLLLAKCLDTINCPDRLPSLTWIISPGTVQWINIMLECIHPTRISGNGLERGQPRILYHKLLVLTDVAHTAFSFQLQLPALHYLNY
ncbi:hypothetical protein EB796_000831 [Bugula neritina]|uniref:Uncharacterized protein n=1 Tax=Bugula neritina TaxID=10212 RepID=A0A7J7KRS6_BUGNE|nr:hypothetical protein EB796_000831 [Bugula neritina]